VTAWWGPGPADNVSLPPKSIFWLHPRLQVDVDVVGMGGVLVFSPSYVAVSQWFDQKKGKAMALSTLGTGLGSVCMAPLIAMLVDQYNYFGTMLIVGALLFNNAVGGALYRAPPEQPRRHTENAKEDKEERELSEKVIRVYILHRLVSRGFFGGSDGSLHPCELT